MTSPQPNIVLFLTDDHGAWAAGCYGNREIHSPNLDRLAARGVRFANAYTPSPVCSPARACLMTGRTPSQVGIHDWLQEAIAEIGEHDWLVDETTLPELLNRSGYRCGLSGKWHLGQSHKTPRGFDWCFGLPGWQGRHNGAYTYHLNGEQVEIAGNKSRLITDHALHFLEESKEDQPFFLNVGYIATHSPYADAEHEPDVVALYRDADFDEIPSYRPHPWHRNEGLAGGFRPSEEDLTSRYRGYYAAVSEIDREVGRILDWLDERGLSENTLVIYTSDHGCALGHQGFWGKGNSTRPLNMYDVSLRVPLIASWPGRIPTGEVCDRHVDHYDTYQSILTASGERSSPSADEPGREWLSLIEGAANDWDDTRFGEYGDLRMIRTPEAKLVLRYPHGPYDLFDLLDDGDESLNRAGWDEYRDLQEELSHKLEAWYTGFESAEKTGLRVKELCRHNGGAEAWRDGKRERRGLQVYS